MQDLNTKFPDIKIYKDEPLSKYTFTKTGGKADYVAFPKDVKEVKELLSWAKEEAVPVTVLGNASNLIVRDGGIKGLVIILTDMNKMEVSGSKIRVQSGAKLIDTSRFALENSLSGLEFACGIPGSVGGAVYMNAGAYGGEVKDVIIEVNTITSDGELKTYNNEEAGFSYRNSIFQDNHEVILDTTFELEEGQKEAIKEEMDDLTKKREEKQPLEYPSCGSVFKRPEGHFAGKLIQDAGLQGYRIGGVEVSKKHAGFMVNIDKGTATDYVELIKHVQDVVYDKFGVKLETEVRIIGEE